MKYLHTNNTEAYQYPMGRALPPGESIELDSDHCPEFLPENKFGTRKVKTATGGAKAPAGNTDPGAAADIQLKEFLKGKADDIVKKLTDAKPEEITVADLDRLEVLEGEGTKPRKSVLEALAETKLRLAAASQS